MFSRAKEGSNGCRLGGVLTALLAASCATANGSSSSPDGGAGGLSSNGGSSSGGSSATGGTSTDTGGTSTGGSSATGGTSTGGTSTGGTSTGGTSTGGTSTGGSGGSPVLGACDALVLDPSVQVASTSTDRVTWSDSNCGHRTAALARNQGGWVRQFTYPVNGTPRTVTGTGANGWNGFGYAVTHYADTAATSQGATGTSSAPFVGRHHAIYRFKFNQNISGHAVPVTVDWFFADGRDHPVYAITYDSSGTTAGTLVADTRSPYGDMAWQGDGGNATVSGVGWGDRYKFVTTQAPLTRDSTWDYTKPNTIPYSMEWENSPDAEMGSVQTQTYLQHDGGGYWLYKDWGKTSANQSPDTGQVGNMPISWNWTYQLNQYELCYPEASSCLTQTTTSHRLCWGANYGAVGGATAGSPNYAAYGDDRQLVGYPYQSYSVFVVLGKHTAAPVAAQVSDIETVQKTTLTAATGTIATTAPAGVGRTDTVTLAPKGYDQRYSTWNVSAAGNAVDLTVNVSQGALVSPVLVISNYTSTTAPSVSVDGTAQTADTDVLVSLDTTNQQVWITFRPGWSGTTHIVVQ